MIYSGRPSGGRVGASPLRCGAGCSTGWAGRRTASETVVGHVPGPAADAPSQSWMSMLNGLTACTGRIPPRAHFVSMARCRLQRIRLGATKAAQKSRHAPDSKPASRSLTVQPSMLASGLSRYCARWELQACAGGDLVLLEGMQHSQRHHSASSVCENVAAPWASMQLGIGA